jgi:hypothetical protein
MNMISAICWTIVLIVNIIICAGSDAPPSWVTMFCALTALVVDSWFNVFLNKKR